VLSDPLTKTGGIEVELSEQPVEIYGWVGDTPSDKRRDFRIVGVRNNTEWTDPEYNLHLPLPEYPDQSSAKQSSSADESSNRDLVDKIEEILEDLSQEEIEALKIAQFQLAGMRRSAVSSLGRNRFKFEVLLD